VTSASIIRFNSFLPPRRSRHHEGRTSTKKNATIGSTRFTNSDGRIRDPDPDLSPSEPDSQGTQDESARVRLCRLQNADAAEAAKMLTQSADLYRDWVTYPTDPDEATAFIMQSPDNGVLIFGIRRRSDDLLVGIATLSRIAYKPWLTAECGAAVGIQYRGNGYMAEGIRLLVRFAVDDLGLHRIEALVQPENIRSIRMLKIAGFRDEGTAHGAVRIQDTWVDHVRWAITAEDLPVIQ
jgi:ribosomal-protein-alanine N-acetyltransferase